MDLSFQSFVLFNFSQLGKIGLQYQLEKDVVPMMVGYAVVGVILALVELLTVVLACAYVAQITRRERRANRSYAINDRHREAAEALRGETEI